MTAGPLPDGAPPDLMLPFGAIADEAGRDLILSGDHADAVLAYCRAMGAKFGAPQIGELAARTGCRAMIQYQFISDFPASFSQAPAYFFGRSGAGHRDTGGGVRERHQRLTVDGQRVA
jgi:hypothetical protein